MVSLKETLFQAATWDEVASGRKTLPHLGSYRHTECKVRGGQAREQHSVETINVYHKSPLGIHYAQKKLMPNHKQACQVDFFCPFISFPYIPYLSLIVEGPGHCLRNGETE